MEKEKKVMKIKLEPVPKLKEEKGTLLPLEITNWTDEEIRVKHAYWHMVHRNKMEWQKVLKHYHIKEYRYSRKTFRKNKGE